MNGRLRPCFRDASPLSARGRYRRLRTRPSAARHVNDWYTGDVVQGEARTLQVPGTEIASIPPDPAESSTKSGLGEPPTDASMAGIRAVWIIGGREEQRRGRRSRREAPRRRTKAGATNDRRWKYSTRRGAQRGLDMALQRLRGVMKHGKEGEQQRGCGCWGCRPGATVTKSSKSSAGSEAARTEPKCCSHAQSRGQMRMERVWE